MAGPYRLQIVPSARRQLEQLPGQARERILQAIRRLARDPRPHGARVLSGESGIWHIRVRDYRVLYQVRDDQFVVLVIRVGHRREVYRSR